MKSNILSIAVLACALLGAGEVDEVNSYFRVSQNTAPLNTPVEVTIKLLDAEGAPVQAEMISVLPGSDAVEVIGEPAPVAGKPGEYTVKVKAATAAETDLTIVADGAAIQENILENPSFEIGRDGTPGYTTTYANRYDDACFFWADKAFRGKHSLGMISLNSKFSTYWGIGLVKDAALLRDHRYIFSVYALYDHVQGERGVCQQIVQRTKADKAIGNNYFCFQTGTVDKWVKLESEPVKIMAEAGMISFSAINLVASGRIFYDCARLRLSPTVRWSAAGPYGASSSKMTGRCFMSQPKEGYRHTLKPDLETAEEALKDAQGKYGAEAAPVVKFGKVLRQYTAIASQGRLSADSAFKLKLEIQEETAKFKKSGGKMAEGELDNLLGE